VKRELPTGKWTMREVELAYIHGHPQSGAEMAQHELAEISGWSRRQIARYCTKGEWVTKKAQARRKSTELASEAIIESKAEMVSLFHNEAAQAARELLRKVRISIEKSCAHDVLRANASTLKDAITSFNLAMGQPTEITQDIEAKLRQLEDDLDAEPGDSL
jgi:hypothetical protein